MGPALITVARFREPWEAHMFRSRLEAEGIPASIVHEFHIWTNWTLSNALGGVKVQVPHEMGSEARAIERRCRAGDFVTELEAEFGDIEIPCCPACGERHFKKERSISLIFLSLIFALVFSAPPPFGWTCRCENCGAKFKLQ